MTKLSQNNPRGLWYQHAIFYELNVRAFYDSNADGYGDLAGLIEKLDYLRDLGVDCIWLMPIYPSPRRDDGYDISDYCDIDPVFGSTDDFKRLLDESHQRGMRVITDLVLNHTSDQHPCSRPPGPTATRPTAITTSGATPTRNIKRPASFSPTPKPPTGPSTPSLGSISGIVSTTPSQT